MKVEELIDALCESKLNIERRGDRNFLFVDMPDFRSFYISFTNTIDLEEKYLVPEKPLKYQDKIDLLEKVGQTLTETVKEQQTEIKRLQNQIENDNREINRLKAVIDRLI